jgi:hypothetical protein
MSSCDTCTSFAALACFLANGCTTQAVKFLAVCFVASTVGAHFNPSDTYMEHRMGSDSCCLCALVSVARGCLRIAGALICRCCRGTAAWSCSAASTTTERAQEPFSGRGKPTQVIFAYRRRSWLDDYHRSRFCELLFGVLGQRSVKGSLGAYVIKQNAAEYDSAKPLIRGKFACTVSGVVQIDRIHLPSQVTSSSSQTKIVRVTSPNYRSRAGQAAKCTDCET